MEGDGQNEDNNIEVSTMAILFPRALLCPSFYFTGAHILVEGKSPSEHANESQLHGFS